MIPVRTDVASCSKPACRAIGRCTGFPWGCHRTLAEVAESLHEPAAEPGPLRPRLPASEIGT